MRNLVWDKFKVLIERGIRFSELDFGDSYELCCFANRISYICQVPKSGGEEQSDYEDNFRGKQGYFFSPELWSDIPSSSVMPHAIGLSDTVNAEETKNIDYEFPDDMIIRGIELMASPPTFGDRVSVTVIDTEGVTGAPPGTPILTPVVDWYISDVERVVSYQAVAPQKALAGMTARFTYVSTALSGSTKLAINLLALKIIK